MYEVQDANNLDVLQALSQVITGDAQETQGTRKFLFKKTKQKSNPPLDERSPSVYDKGNKCPGIRIF